MNSFIHRIGAAVRARTRCTNEPERRHPANLRRGISLKEHRKDPPSNKQRTFIVCLLMGAVLPLPSALATPVRGTGVENVNSLNQAAAMMLDLEATTTAEMKACQATASRGAYIYQFANYVWHGENYGLLQIAKSVLSADQIQAMRPELKTRADTAAHDIDVNPSSCAERLRVIEGGMRDVRENFPRTYAYLSETYAKSLKLVATQEQESVEIGCMKRAANIGATDFERTLGVCQCTREAIYSALTVSERKDLFAHGNDKDYAIHAPWAPRLREKGLACIAKLPHQ